MYGFTTTLSGPTFDQALAKTLAALKAEGFGVLSDIDVQHAMKEKSSIRPRPSAARLATASPMPARWSGSKVSSVR